MVVKDGRFGPYVTDGETNACLRKGDTVENVTIERAAELLQIRREAGPAKKARKGAKKAPAKKTRQEGHEEGRRRRRRRRRRRPRRPPRPRPSSARRRHAAGPNVDPMAEQRQVPLPGLEDPAADAPTEPAPVVGDGRQARLPRAHVRQLAVLPPVARAGAQLHRRLARASSPSPRWPRASAARLAGGRRRRGDVGPHRPRASSSAPRRASFADRFDRKKLMVGCNVGRARRARRAALRRHRVRPGVRVAAARVLHAAVDAGQGGVGPEPRAARPPHHRQLAVARRGLRHLAARRRPLLGAGVGVEGASARSTRSTRSGPTRRRSPSTSNAATFLVVGRDDLAARSCPSTSSAASQTATAASTSGRPSAS